MAIFPQGSAKKDTSLPFGQDAAPPAREPTPAVADFGSSSDGGYLDIPAFLRRQAD